MRKPISEASGCDVATQPCVQITGLRREVKVTSGLQSGLCIFVLASKGAHGRTRGGDRERTSAEQGVKKTIVM